MIGISALDQLRGTAPSNTVRTATDGEPVVGSYARISDAYEGKETGVTTHGVERQLQANRHIAKARGWLVHDREYVDNNVSAYQAGVERDAFEDLLADLEAGVIQGVVCYNLDRFARQVPDLERAIAIYDEARRQGRILYFATAEGDLNLASDDGLTMARVMVAFANKASRDTGRRVALKRKQQRDKAQIIGSHRPFGWTYEGNGSGRIYVQEPREAASIRWAAEGLIDGTLTWSAITARWNADALLTPRGGHWGLKTVKQVMRSPRLAGWLVHENRIAVNSETGKLVRSNLPAILTDDEFEALLVAIERKGSAYAAVSGRRAYLLSGIVRCAECGAKLRGRPLARTPGTYAYACPKHGGEATTDGRPTCGRTYINGNQLDELVVAGVLPHIIEASREATAEQDELHSDEILALETEKDQLLTAYRERRATSELVFPEVTRIEHELERLRHERAEARRAQRAGRRSLAITEANWEPRSVEEKRGILEGFVEAIYVSPATRRGARFDPARVSEPVWRNRAAPAVDLVASGQ